jgi:hypothetical protein
MSRTAALLAVLALAVSIVSLFISLGREEEPSDCHGTSPTASPPRPIDPEPAATAPQFQGVPSTDPAAAVRRSLDAMVEERRDLTKIASNLGGSRIADSTVVVALPESLPKEALETAESTNEDGGLTTTTWLRIDVPKRFTVVRVEADIGENGQWTPVSRWTERAGELRLLHYEKVERRTTYSTEFTSKIRTLKLWVERR